MREKLIDEISKKFEITQKELIEKDIILHEILTHLSQDSYFSKNFLFKGGTCLVKSYLGYVRFSEDLDFTWINQNIYQGKNPSAITKYLSTESEQLGRIFEEIARKFSLDFKFDKTNTRYFQYGSGGKMLTLYIWYNSEILKEETMVKIQINYVETILYPFENKQLKSLAIGDKDLKFLFSDHSYFNEIQFAVYSPKEILCEKIRAILTRRGIKARDFLDLYLVCKKFEINLSEIIDNAIQKTKFAFDMYERYRDNLKEKSKLLDSGNLFEWGEEKRLLLQDVDDDDFNSFNNKLEKILKDPILKSITK